MNVRNRLDAIEADITTLAFDAIVNAANEPLIMGGGVDGAIRRKAGHEMEDEIRKIGRCPTGEAVITKGHRLPARFVIHTVAPVFHGGGTTAARKEELLASCYRNALQRADENAIATIAFPCVGTGIYGWPSDLACGIAIDAVVSHLRNSVTQACVTFCCFAPKDRELYAARLAAVSG